MNNQEKKDKKYFDVKVECLLPATLTYRVLAEDEVQAVALIKNINPNTIKHRLVGRKEIKISVYDAGSNLLRFVRHLFGG
jgi:hypothetical protein